MKHEYWICVFLKERVCNSKSYDYWLWDDAIKAKSLKYNKKGEYLLNKDNGNTKYLLSIINSNRELNRNGILFKGLSLGKLNEFLKLRYCGNYGLCQYKFIYDSGLKILYLEYDTESG